MILTSSGDNVVIKLATGTIGAWPDAEIIIEARKFSLKEITKETAGSAHHEQ